MAGQQHREAENEPRKEVGGGHSGGGKDRGTGPESRKDVIHGGVRTWCPREGQKKFEIFILWNEEPNFGIALRNSNSDPGAKRNAISFTLQNTPGRGHLTNAATAVSFDYHSFSPERKF